MVGEDMIVAIRAPLLRRLPKVCCGSFVDFPQVFEAPQRTTAHLLIDVAKTYFWGVYRNMRCGALCALWSQPFIRLIIVGALGLAGSDRRRQRSEPYRHQHRCNQWQSSSYAAHQRRRRRAPLSCRSCPSRAASDVASRTEPSSALKTNKYLSTHPPIARRTRAAFQRESFFKFLTLVV